MATNRIGGPPGQAPKVTPAETAKAQEVKAQSPAQRASAPELPKVQKGFANQQSPLSEVIRSGLTKLAQGQGWENKEKALDVLIRTMGATALAAPPNLEVIAAKYRQQLRSARMKRAKKLGKADLEEAKEDADSLLALAVVALGDDGEEKRRGRDQQLLLDLDELHSAVVDVLHPDTSGKPAPSGVQAQLLSRAESLAWANSVVHRGKAALEGAHIQAEARVEALAGILRILAKYAEE